MIRIICCEVSYARAMHIGGPAEIRYKTFDVPASEVERWLGEPSAMNDHHTDRTITGVEIVKEIDNA